jgi:hypothetical protein
MSDRTSMSAIVSFDRKPSAEARKRFAEISDTYYGEDWGMGDPDRHTLSFGVQENVCGKSEDLFEQLRDALPDAAEVVVWEDPKYEWLGQTFRWKHGQEIFSAECDASGRVVLTEIEVEKILDGVATRPAADAVIEVRELRTKFLEAIGKVPA